MKKTNYKKSCETVPLNIRSLLKLQRFALFKIRALLPCPSHSVSITYICRYSGTGTKRLQTKRLQTKRLQTERLLDKRSTGQKVYRDKTSTGQNVYGTKRLQGQNVYGTKHLLHKKFNGTKFCPLKYFVTLDV